MMEKAYKFKNVSLQQDENGYNYIKIKLVESFIDGKHNKFIPLSEAVEVINNAVVYEKDFNSIISKNDKKRQKKMEYKQKLADSILLSME